MLIKNENGGEPTYTTIQRGDTCVWIVSDGTVAFNRGGTKLRRFDGDDKFLLQFNNPLQFAEFAQAIADAVGLQIECSGDTGRCVAFRFI